VSAENSREKQQLVPSGRLSASTAGDKFSAFLARRLVRLGKHFAILLTVSTRTMFKDW
jgi:hypothetical protein